MTSSPPAPVTERRAPTGYVIYRGPSRLDGAPIIVVAITRSENKKTGDMVQTYILREDLEPHTALKTGADASVCGDCKLRGSGCYVRVDQGPLVVYRAYRRGMYPDALNLGAIQTLGYGRLVRLGAYGDPAAVPAWVWTALTCDAAGHTGYTHQWQRADAAALQGLCMASVDTPAERLSAAEQGWRTFRSRLSDEPLAPGEFACPASDEEGARKTCAQCRACDGVGVRGTVQASPAIVIHGASFKVNKYIEIRRAL